MIVDGEPLEVFILFKHILVYSWKLQEKLGLNLEQPKNNNKRTIRAVQPTIALPKVVKAPKESNESEFISTNLQNIDSLLLVESIMNL